MEPDPLSALRTDAEAASVGNLEIVGAVRSVGFVGAELCPAGSSCDGLSASEDHHKSYEGEVHPYDLLQL